MVDVRFYCVHMSENDLFSGKIYVEFLLSSKFSLVNGNHTPHLRLVFNPVSWKTPVISNPNKKIKNIINVNLKQNLY